MKSEIRNREKLTRKIVVLSLLAAMSIILGKYLAIPWGNIMRFSLENMPIFFAAFAFGPIEAGAVALVADLVGCLLVGYTINPLVTLGGVMLAVSGAFLYRWCRSLPMSVRLSVSVLVGHIVGSVFIKTAGLAIYYDMHIVALMLWRLFNYVIVGVMDGIAVFLLMKSPVIRIVDEGMPKKAKKRPHETAEKKPFTYEEAIAYIHSTNRPFCKPGLERVSALLSALGHPERELSCIHIGGTNGKGSTSSMLASVLGAAGYRVGLYTSPYILEFNERIRVNGENISDEDLAKYTNAVRERADKLSECPTEFEIITAIAFAYFRDKECDYVVLEVGLGGRFDATNVIEKPLLSIITGISLDHVSILGDTIEKIAFEKAGIIKSGCPVLYCGERESDAREVIMRESESRKSPYYETSRDAIQIVERNLKGCTFDYKGLQNVRISLLGTYQPYNAIAVIEAVDILRANGVFISESDLYTGLLSARWMARFEVLQNECPLLIFDGAHNAEGITNAVESIRTYFGEEKVYVLTGVLRDKDYTAIAECISTVAERAYTITPQNSRALDATTYASLLNHFGTKARAFVDEGIEVAFTCAYREAKKSGRALIVLGSLYTYGDIYRAHQNILSSETK